MNKTAIEVAVQRTPTATKLAGPAVRGGGSNAEIPDRNPFPPVETALTSIVNNKKLGEAKSIS